MTIAFFEFTGTSRRLIKSGFSDLDAAIDAANKEFQISYLARDQDTDNCADFITKCGRCIAIEPA